MGNQFDDEMKELRRETSATGSKDVQEAATERLNRLERALTSAATADVACERNEPGALAVSVKGQAVGVWKIEGPNLALYRSDDASPDCQATSVSEAAKLTARLVAAVGQA